MAKEAHTVMFYVLICSTSLGQDEQAKLPDNHDPEAGLI